MLNKILKSHSTFISLLALLIFISPGTSQAATPQSCSTGIGDFANWSGGQSGTATFSASGVNLPLLPNFSYAVTGDDNGTSIDGSESFSGSNQFEPIYGEADSEENLNVRVDPNNGSVGDSIDRSTQLKIVFDSNTPSYGWAFSMHDFDDDQATISAKDINGNDISNAVIDSWFIELFDPSTSGGTQLAVWDSANVTVVGAGSSGVNTRSTTIRNTDNSIEAPGIWFQPNVALSELSIQFESVTRVDASYHIYLASCLEPLSEDRSDAPADGSVPPIGGIVTTSYGIATHQIVSGVQLGSLIDHDPSDISSASVDGDGADDDGVSIPPLTLGLAATITVDVSGAGGMLQAWVDWNGDGDFADLGEQLLTNVQDGGIGDLDSATGKIGFTVTPALTATTETTVARFRWSTTPDLGSATAASDGEVEDYALNINAPAPSDFGDAPATFSDAAAIIDPNIYLGVTAPDSEANSLNDYQAAGDGVEDDGAPQSSGVTLFPILIETQSSYATPITVNNSSGGAATLEGWIDYDHSGTFDADEKTSVAVPDATIGTVSLDWSSLPSDIGSGTTFIRLRLTNDSTGAGEVEDHVISIAVTVPPESPNVSVIGGEAVRSCQAVIFSDDFDDLAEYLYMSPNSYRGVSIRDWTTTGGGEDTYAGTRSQGSGDTAIYLGNGTVRRISPSMTALGGLNFDNDGRLTSVIDAIELRSGPDDVTPGTGSWEADWGRDEVVFSRTFASVAGKKYRLYFNAVPEAASEDGIPKVAGMMRIDTPVGSAHFLAPASGTGEISYAIEFTATGSSSTIGIANYGHIGGSEGGSCNPQAPNAWCTLGGTNDGFATNEVIVDDLYLVEATCDSDYSDAPANGSAAPDGSSTTAYGEASHDVVSGIHLGAVIDLDSSSVTSANADGDGSDDDGVTLPAFSPGASVSIDVLVNQTVANSGYLQAWIDWNGDGDFADSGEQVATDLQDGGGLDTNPAAGTIAFTVNVPSDAVTTQTFARFRWSTTAGLDATTAASDGEVEDYAINIAVGRRLAGTIYEDINADSNMSDQVVRDAVSVTLYKDDGNGIPDAADTVSGTTTSDTNGRYSFTVEDGNYWVVVDSKTVSPSAGYNGLFSIDNVWAEQTWGAADTWGGSLCDSDADSSTTATALSTSGACFGGRNGDTSDDASALDTAEHVAQVTLSGADVTGVDFGFSFNAVTNTNNDGDDDTTADRTLQGTLRQFIQNANAVSGANSMHFVPAVPLNAVTYIDTPATHQWWKVEIDAGNGLASITDSYTSVDGTAYSYTDGITVRDTNLGTTRSVTETAIGVGSQLPLAGVPRPELEIHNVTSTVAKGLAVEASNATIKSLAIYGFGQAGQDNTSLSDANIYIGSVSGWLIDGVYVGVRPDIDQNALSRSYSDRPRTTGIGDMGRGHGVLLNGSGSGLINNTNVVDNALHGIFMNNASSVELSLVQASDSGFWSRTSDGLFVKNSRNINIQQSLFVDNWGAGIDSEMMTNLNMHHNKVNSNRNEGGIRIWGHDNSVTQTVVFNNKVMSGITVVKNSDSYNNYFHYNNYDQNFGVPIDLIKDSTDPLQESLVTANDGVRTPNTGNNSLDYPVMEMAVLSNNQVHIKGYVGTPTQKIEELLNVEIYLVKTGDDDQNGEVFLGDGKSERHGEGYSFNNNCSTTADGNFYCIFGSAGYTSNVGNQFAGVTTDSNKNTSEFGVSATFTDEVDYSDAPVDYGSDATETFHALGASLTLGATVDAEKAATHNAAANGDDIDGTDDDEDALTTPLSVMTTDTSYSLTIPVNNATGRLANLVGWIDFDGNKVFDTNEAATVAVPDATAGNVTLTWSSIPADIVEGSSYLRLRLTTDTSIATGNAATSIPTTGAYDGEVEDYAITIIGGQTLSGTVFEDINYGGGVGRDQISAVGAGVNGAVVELYDNTGALIASTTTANDGTNDGAYEFTGLINGDYHVRVVSDTISSTRSGSDGSELAVQTFRTDGTTPVTAEVGGRQPTLSDGTAQDVASPSILNTTSYAFTGGTLDGGQAQSVTPVTLAGADIIGIDFGYNFDTIVNANDAGQGSLRQFILNSNLLSDEASLAQVGQTAGWETSIFMIPSGNLSAGVATIELDSALPIITGSSTAVDAGTQTSNIGNTNAGVSGTGGTVGVDNLPLPQYQNPEVEIDANDFSGLRVESAGEVLIARLAIYDNDASSALIDKAGVGLTSATRLTIENAFIGPRATGADPGAGERIGRIYDDVDFTAPPNVVFRDSLFAYSENSGLHADVTGGTYSLSGSELHHLALSNSGQDAVDAGGTWTTIGNLMHNNGSTNSSQSSGGAGFELGAANNDQVSANSVIENNTLHNNFGPGIRLRNTVSNTLVRKNVIYENLYAGVQVQLRAAGIGVESTISQNSIYNNTELGIDISHDTTDGNPDQVTLNDANDADSGPNGGLNFPQFTRAVHTGSDLIIQGCAPTGSTVELFEADVSSGSGSGASVGDNRFGKTQDYGEGETYIDSFEEGVGEDSTLAAVNCSGLSDADGNDATGMSPFQWRMTLPAGLQVGDKLTATATISGTGTSEFSAVAIIAGQDYGDAPNTYNTTLAADGARHDVINEVYLGSTKPDVDSDGQPDSAASGDGADEDGIASFGALTTSDRTYSAVTRATNSTSDTATLIAWIDFDGNGRFDADEAAIRSVPAGTSASNITLNWSSIPLDIKAGGTYVRVRLTTDSLNNREPDGAKLDGEVEDYPITITTAGVTVSGRVFNDANVNAANDSGEVGVTRLPVVLYDTVNNTCVSTRTDGNGDYRFEDVVPGTYRVYEASRESVPVPASCGIASAKNPSSYRSTTDNVRAEFTVSTNDITGQDFGDVKLPVFEPDNTGQILPGNVLFYAHKFSTPAKGSVSFSSVSSGNKSSGWSSIIYRDANCDGTLNGSEGAAPIGTGSMPVDAESEICLINKVYAPSNVAANDQYVQSITADFDFNNAIAGTLALKVQDVTTAQQVQAPALPATPEVVAAPVTPVQAPVAATPTTPYIPEIEEIPAQAPVAATPVTPAVGPSRLELRKTVRNIDTDNVETDTVNAASPGDTLEYRIYYSNTGTGPLTDLVVNDVIPAYTELVGALDCGAVLTGMSCATSPVGLNGSLQWKFTGTVVGGAGSSVSYRVIIDE